MPEGTPTSHAREVIEHERRVARQLQIEQEEREHRRRRAYAAVVPGFGTTRRRQPAVAAVPAIPTLLSEESGSTIVSLRKFGIEFEINFPWRQAEQLRALIGQVYNFVHDGSVRNGLEIVSPIMQGRAGEDQIDSVCKHAQENGAGTDETCGLHVHFDAPDFYKASQTEIYMARDVIKKGDKSPGLFLIHPTALNFFYKNHRSIWSLLINRSSMSRLESEVFWRVVRTEMGTREVFVVGEDYKEAKGYSHCSMPGMHMITYARSRQVFPDAQAASLKDGSVVAEKFDGNVAFCPAYNTIIIKSFDKYRVVIDKNKNKQTQVELTRLKRLGAFYAAFDDVIAAMLPQDRRANQYARRANQRLSIEQIRDCESTLEFFKLWFNYATEEQVLANRGQERPRARYCGLNLYSIFKHGTIEVRYLQGTLDPMLIKSWVHLHQAILDGVAETHNPLFSLERLQRASNIVDVTRKANLFFRKLKLRPDVEEYLRGLIETNKSADDELLNDCIEDDMTAIDQMVRETGEVEPRLNEDNLQRVHRDMQFIQGGFTIMPGDTVRLNPLEELEELNRHNNNL